MTDDNDVDTALRNAGARWRRGVPDTAHVEPAWFLRKTRDGANWLHILALGASVFALATFALWQGQSGAPPSGSSVAIASDSRAPTIMPTLTPRQPPSFVVSTASPGPTASAIHVVADGDHVTARGFLLLGPTGDLRLCTGAVSPAMDDAVASCVEPSVRVAHDVTGYVGSYVQVDGIWSDDVLEPRSLSLDDFPETPDPTAPCEEPAGGWRGNGDPLEAEAAGRRLEDLIASRPDEYAGFWSASIPGDRVFVVATTGDPGKATDEVRALFRGNLCVVSVEFSKRELDSTAERLRAYDSTWSVEVDAVANQVALRVPVIDAETAARLLPERAIVDVQPVVQLAASRSS